jgi:hypothetical protein
MSCCAKAEKSEKKGDAPWSDYAFRVDPLTVLTLHRSRIPQTALLPSLAAITKDGVSFKTEEKGRRRERTECKLQRSCRRSCKDQFFVLVCSSGPFSSTSTFSKNDEVGNNLNAPR